MTPGTAGALEIAMGTPCEHGKTILLATQTWIHALQLRSQQLEWYIKIDPS